MRISSSPSGLSAGHWAQFRWYYLESTARLEGGHLCSVSTKGTPGQRRPRVPGIVCQRETPLLPFRKDQGDKLNRCHSDPPQAEKNLDYHANLYNQALAALLDYTCPMAGQAVKSRFTVRVCTCAQAIRAHLIRLRDRGYSHPATGGAALPAAGIDTAALAKSTANIGCPY